MVKVQLGDLAAVKTETAGGGFIIVKDWALSPDNEAIYSHTLIIADEHGATFEARPSRGLSYYSLYDYIGHQVLIVRPKVCNKDKKVALDTITAKLKGKPYPKIRILLHAISRPLAKWFHLGVPVCSESTAFYAFLMGIGDNNYFGRTPDMEADRWEDSKHFYVVYEGILKPPDRPTVRAKGE